MKRRLFYDRKDARRVPMVGLLQLAVDLKPQRCVSDVYINEKADVTALVNYLERLKASGDHYTYFHAFLTAIGKTIYSRPKLNTFIQNRHLYEHNEVSLAFVAKMALNDKAEEIMVHIVLDPEDTMETIREKCVKKLSNLRGEHVTKQGANTAIDVLGHLPNIIRVPILGVIKWLDKHGILPAGLTKDNIYYSSMIVSNLGSIHCEAIYHNITDFGTSSSLATIGEIRDLPVYGEDGELHPRKICEFGVTIDERIADGFYLSKSIQLMKEYLNRPECLMEPIGPGK